MATRHATESREGARRPRRRRHARHEARYSHARAVDSPRRVYVRMRPNTRPVRTLRECVGERANERACVHACTRACECEGSVESALRRASAKIAEFRMKRSLFRPAYFLIALKGGAEGEGETTRVATREDD